METGGRLSKQSPAFFPDRAVRRDPFKHLFAG